MRITKSKQGVYYLRYREASGQRRSKSLGTRDRMEAEKRAAAIMRGDEAEVGITLAGRHTLGEALLDTYRRIWDKQKDKSKAGRVNALVKAIGHWRLNDVTYERLAEFCEDQHNTGVSGSTINRKMATIGKALREAVKLGWLQTVPSIPRYKEAAIKERYVSREEEAALLDATHAVGWKQADRIGMWNLIVFLVDTGARFGEAMRAAEDVRNGARVGTTLGIYVNKADKPRTVPLTERAQEALAEGWPAWDSSQAAHRFKRVATIAGVEGVTLHTLRHTCASRLVGAGMDLYRVRDWLGHKSITTTERYAHLDTDALAEGVSMLEAAASSRRGKLTLVR